MFKVTPKKFMKRWDQLADDATIETTVSALKKNGIDVVVVANGQEAKERALSFIPKGATVMTATSKTADQIGLAKEIDESGNYDSTRKKIMVASKSEIRNVMRRANATVDYVVGSVHAVTVDGQVLIASNSGSQLAPYVFSAGRVIWVVGTQKIVKNLDEGMRRIYEYLLPVESERVKKAYRLPRSDVSKILIINREKNQGRITMILIKEKLGV